MILLAALAATVAAFQAPEPQATTFKAGTRLVEVEVVVRNRNGPVANLSKDDFTILDQRKPQRIDVFRQGQSATKAQTIPVPPGAVSNRGSSASNAPAGYTAVLFDQLNTRVDLKEYERNALVKFLRHLDPSEHVAIYVLGSSLHVLQEFTDDPAKLIAAIQHLDSGRDLMPANVHDAMFGFETDMLGQLIPMGGEGGAVYAHSVAESAGNVAQVNAARNRLTTEEALSIIARHLAGMPGRRNLVWMTENWTTGMPVMGLLQQSRIALYPVMARSLDFNPLFMDFSAVDRTPGGTLFPDVMDFQRKNRQFAAQTGGAGFGDATDVGLAVKTAEEDSRTAYTLGYYPPEELLDGKYHTITVKVEGQKEAHLELYYRPGYPATKQPSPEPPPQSVADIFRNPLDNTAVGITAQVDTDSAPGRYHLQLTLDLHDLHLTHEGGHSRGSVQMAFLTGAIARVFTVPIDVTDEHLPAALQSGYSIDLAGVRATGNVIRLLARDPSTGVAGSLTIPVQARKETHLH